MSGELLKVGSGREREGSRARRKLDELRSSQAVRVKGRRSYMDELSRKQMSDPSCPRILISRARVDVNAYRMNRGRTGGSVCSNDKSVGERGTFMA
jgi:hypothetical protein